MQAEDCFPAWRSHRWDPVSGYCTWGCGNRDDGRVVSRAGSELRAGPIYTVDELERFRRPR